MATLVDIMKEQQILSCMWTKNPVNRSRSRWECVFLFMTMTQNSICFTYQRLDILRFQCSSFFLMTFCRHQNAIYQFNVTILLLYIGMSHFVSWLYAIIVYLFLSFISLWSCHLPYFWLCEFVFFEFWFDKSSISPSCWIYQSTNICIFVRVLFKWSCMALFLYRILLIYSTIQLSP